jgi:ribA/ribD-fused uncharacterized protein
MSDPIYGFSGPYDFLSNFHPSPIRLLDDPNRYPTVEHAFQAAKTLDEDARTRIAGLGTPGAAKRAGRAVALRADWEIVKDVVMLACLRAKFAPGSSFAEMLLETGDRELVEANAWGDRVWGVDRRTGAGENRLGLLLMRVRTELRVAR